MLWLFDSVFGIDLIYRMAFASGDLLCQPLKVIGGLI